MFPKLELSKRNPKKASGLNLKLRSLRDHRQLLTTKHRFPRRHQFPIHQTIMEILMILSRLENKLKSKRRKAWEIQIIRRMPMSWTHCFCRRKDKSLMHQESSLDQSQLRLLNKQLVLKVESLLKLGIKLWHLSPTPSTSLVQLSRIQTISRHFLTITKSFRW